MLCQSTGRRRVGDSISGLVGEVLKRQNGLKALLLTAWANYLLERLRNRKMVRQIPVIEKVNLIFKIRGPAVIVCADRSVFLMFFDFEKQFC